MKGSEGMTNPYGQFDRDGMPSSTPDPAPWNMPSAPNAPQPYQQPGYGQQQGFAQQPGYGQQPVGAYGAMNPMGAGVSPKSKMAAILLCFFLGGLGIHNFYLGNTGRGVAQLILTILGWATAVLIVGIFMLAAVSIWVLVEFIMLIVGSGTYRYDSDGRVLS